MAQYAVHTRQDATLIVNTALGDNNATTSTNAIDLGAATPFPTTGQFSVQVVTTVAVGANNKNVNITIQDSNVNTAANFVNIAGLATLTIPEVTATYAATTRNVALPPATRRFIRLLCITENAGGNATNGTATLKLLF